MIDPNYYCGSDDRELDPDPDAGACPDCGAAEDQPCERYCECEFCREMEWAGWGLGKRKTEKQNVGP